MSFSTLWRLPTSRHSVRLLTLVTLSVQSSRAMATAQLWLWFLGTLALTIPWHVVGLLWMPRRTASSPYDPEIVARWSSYTAPMIAGGGLMVLSAMLFLANLLLTHGNRAAEPERGMEYADTLEPVVTVPSLLNGFAVWNWLVLVLMLVAFAYPIGQFFFIDVHEALPWGPR